MRQLSFCASRRAAGARLAVLAVAAFPLVNLIAVTDAAASGSYAVIVNAANDYKADDEAAASLVRSLFLKERLEWPDGTTVKPFASVGGGDVHSSFLQAVLSMTEAELAKHWLAVKQRTGRTAPREVSSSRLMLKLVAKYEGGLGVVEAAEADGADGVRVLLTFP